MRLPERRAPTALEPPWRHVSQAAVLAVALASGVGGCGSLLPAATTDANDGFRSFEQAERALARVVPYRTTLAELETLGFRTEGSANVVRIPYPDSIARLAPNSAVPLDALDRGIRDCIVARSDCRVYEFRFARQSQKRVGPFLLDFFNFKRRTVVSGFNFNALLVLKDGTVLFSSYGGEPQIDRIEQRVNPLGPLQSTGEASGGALLR